jgi:putative endonuclease
MNTKVTGNLGENIAARYLINSGYEIIERNYREGADEIDIIATSQKGMLIFFEVKAMTVGDGYRASLCGFMPEDHLNWQKLKRISRACQKFAVRNRRLIDEDEGWQIDLIAIVIKGDKKYDLRHYKNVSL